MDRGQHGSRGTLGTRLMDKSGGTYHWYTIVFFTSKDAPSLSLVGQSISTAFNTFNTNKAKKPERFELGEAVGVNAKPLSYHIEENNVTKILRNLLGAKVDRNTLLRKSALMSGFYNSTERGLELLRCMTNEDFDEYLEQSE